jgi:pyruvate dehydrogenase E1 component alpha subunit
LKYYEQMQLIRRMEMKADALYKNRMIRGFCHLSIGQEAIPVGVEAAIGPNDQIITAYRCHGFALMRGGSVRSILGELLGKKTGITKGKGGSMHMFADRFYGGNGIVGAQVPLGTGLGFAIKYRNDMNSKQDDSISLTFYGDGAANQGQVFESYNMAALWKLPVIFICENNKYAMGTSIERSTADPDFYKRGIVIPGLQINAMDLFAVRQSIKFAKRWASEGRGPLVMDFKTYRYQGHSMSDPGTTYRTRKEISNVRSQNDPLKLLTLQITKAGIDEKELEKIEERVKEQVEREAEEAINDPLPNVKEDLWTDIY